VRNLDTYITEKLHLRKGIQRSNEDDFIDHWTNLLYKHYHDWIDDYISKYPSNTSYKLTDEEIQDRIDNLIAWLEDHRGTKELFRFAMAKVPAGFLAYLSKNKIPYRMPYEGSISEKLHLKAGTNIANAKLQDVLEFFNDIALNFDEYPKFSSSINNMLNDFKSEDFVVLMSLQDYNNFPLDIANDLTYCKDIKKVRRFARERVETRLNNTCFYKKGIEIKFINKPNDMIAFGLFDYNQKYFYEPILFVDKNYYKKLTMKDFKAYITEKLHLRKGSVKNNFENELEEDILSICYQFCNEDKMEDLILDFLRNRKWWNYRVYIHEEDSGKINLNDIPEKKVKTYKAKSKIDKEINGPYGSCKNTYTSKDKSLFIDFREESPWASTALKIESDKLSNPILIKISEIPGWRYSSNN